MTRTTSATVIISVSFTSCGLANRQGAIAADVEASPTLATALGWSAAALIRSTVSTTFTPGCFCTGR